MNAVKNYEIKEKYNIKVYMGNYDEKEFYSIMGKFFADRFYKKMLPYLINDIDKIWYLIYERNIFIGFYGLKICADYTLISDIYINDRTDKKDIFNYMSKYLVEIYKEENLKVLTKHKNEILIWENLGFLVLGNRGKYTIMLKEKQK